MKQIRPKAATLAVACLVTFTSVPAVHAQLASKTTVNPSASKAGCTLTALRPALTPGIPPGLAARATIRCRHTRRVSVTVSAHGFFGGHWGMAESKTFHLTTRANRTKMLRTPAVGCGKGTWRTQAVAHFTVDHKRKTISVTGTPTLIGC